MTSAYITYMNKSGNKVTEIYKDSEMEMLRFYNSNKEEVKELATLNQTYQSLISKSMLSFERQDDKKGAGSGSYQRTLQEYDRMLENYNWAKASIRTRHRSIKSNNG